MTQGSGDFFDKLRGMDRQSGKRFEINENATVLATRKITDTMALADSTPEISERATSAQTYLCMADDNVLNGNFETDLTSWTERNHVSITATTTQAGEAEAAKTVFASLGSLKINVTASTAGGQQAERYQDIDASVGQVWSFETWARFTNLTSCTGYFRIEWRNAGESVISAAQVTVSSDDTVFTLRQLLNQTAPATTDHVRIILKLQSTGFGAIGLGYYDLVRAEIGVIAVSDRERRIIVGEWVCRT